MKDRDFATMSVDELWRLHERTRAMLSTKLGAEMQQLERRLARLKGRPEHQQRVRRFYPTVQPKYRNPEQPAETWSGRGKQPRWVHAHLNSGKKVEDLLISRPH